MARRPSPELRAGKFAPYLPTSLREVLRAGDGNSRASACWGHYFPPRV